MINLSVPQIIIAVISLFYILNSTARFLKREKRLSLLKFLSTTFIWTSILCITVFPFFFKSILKTLGLEEDFNLIILAGFIVVFILIFRLLAIIERIERDITEIIRKEALKELKKGEK